MLLLQTLSMLRRRQNRNDIFGTVLAKQIRRDTFGFYLQNKILEIFQAFDK